MKFLLKVMANLAEPHGGDASDRLITALSKMAPGRMTRRAISGGAPRIGPHRRM